MDLNKPINKLLFLIIGIIFLTFTGINWHFALTAWLAPVFLLLFTRGSKTGGFLLFFLFALISGTISRTGLSLTGHILEHIFNGIYPGIYIVIPFLIDRIFYKKQKGFYTTLLFPIAFVLIEFLVSVHVGNWGSFAHTQFAIKPLIQIGSLTGSLALTFLITWPASIIVWIFEHKDKVQGLKKGIIVYGIILLLIFIYGIGRTAMFQKESETVKIAGVSGDIDIHKLMIDEFETIFQFTEGNISEIPERIFCKNDKLTEMINNTLIAAKTGAKIIVWNEISLIISEKQNIFLEDTLKQIAAEYNCYILPAVLKENEKGADKPFRNTCYLITPEKKIAYQYSKSALHPQGEVPIIEGGDFKIPFYDTEYGRLGSVICYDMDFPNFIHQAGKNEIDIMLVPAYDWKGITPFHSHMAAFEAVQNGFSLVRPNGKGLSAAYDPFGNTLSELNTFETDEKIFYADVATESVSTLYKKTGNVFVILCLIGLIFFGIIRFLSKQKNS